MVMYKQSQHVYVTKFLHTFHYIFYSIKVYLFVNYNIQHFTVHIHEITHLARVMFVIATGWCIQRVAENITGITPLVGSHYCVWNMSHLTSEIPSFPPLSAVINNLKIAVKKQMRHPYFTALLFTTITHDTQFSKTYHKSNLPPGIPLELLRAPFHYWLYEDKSLVLLLHLVTAAHPRIEPGNDQTSAAPPFPHHLMLHLHLRCVQLNLQRCHYAYSSHGELLASHALNHQDLVSGLCTKSTRTRIQVRQTFESETYSPYMDIDSALSKNN
jgi:hypothetical protein